MGIGPIEKAALDVAVGEEASTALELGASDGDADVVSVSGDPPRADAVALDRTDADDPLALGVAPLDVQATAATAINATTASRVAILASRRPASNPSFITLPFPIARECECAAETRAAGGS